MKLIGSLVVLLAILMVVASAKPYPKLTVQSADDSMGCVLCEFVMSELFDWLSANTTAPEIEKYLDTICAKLPFPGNYECEWLVKEVTHVIPIIVYNIPRQDIHPIDVCGLVKRCEVKCCASAAPEQVRLSGTTDASVMYVAWVQTGNFSDAVVEYGVSETSLSMKVAAHVHTYHSGNWKGFIYNATLQGLNEKAQYFYRVGAPSGGYYSAVRRFTTYTNALTPDLKTKWAVYGDMGTNHESDDTIERMKEIVKSGGVDGILHNGDLAYADGVQRRWDEFGRKVEEITSSVQYQTVPGNHEMAIVTYLGLEGYKNRWFMPYDWPLERDGGQEAYWYTFTRGPLRVIGLNSESHLDISLISPAQLAWLTKTMTEVQATRQNHPWVVVMLHRPLYCSGSRHTECGTMATWLKEWLEDIFQQNKVDLVITAHMHYYERSLPVYKDTPYPGLHNAQAPVYIVNGAAGSREGLSGFQPTAPSWSASRVHNFGYGLLDVSYSQLSWQFFTSSDNVLQDSMTLTRS